MTLSSRLMIGGRKILIHKRKLNEKMKPIFEGEEGERLRMEFQMWWETLILPRMDSYWEGVYNHRKQNYQQMTQVSPFCDMFKLNLKPTEGDKKKSLEI